MSKRDAGLLLADMREAMGKIARYVEGMSREAFVTDEKDDRCGRAERWHHRRGGESTSGRF
jgi:hypothetical protein